MTEVRAIWELTRGEHGLMYGAGVLIGILVGGGNFGITAVLGFFTAFFIQAGTFALNDYCDLETDIANHRLDRPLVRGALTKELAFGIACIATALGILSSVVLTMLHGGLTLFLVALLLAALGILYDIKIKELFAVGNLYIAFTMAVPFIYGGLIAGDIGEGLLILSFIALLAGLGREVMKDIADIEGDEIRDVRSIARVYGIEEAKKVVTASSLLAVGLSVVPFFLPSTPYYLNPIFIILVSGTDIIFAHTINELWKQHVNYEQLRKETLVAIAIGLLAFICGAIL
ncbi:MAG: UbiA family prenyltransferase [Methanophagales archaeon]|nr:UbiA family prenyltransferase [Methanophagales archaeon]MCW7072917.1 UbiA family prenyltransferase [Methanophagales archaeon]